MKKAIILMSLVLVASISGCINLDLSFIGGIWDDFFGEDVIQINKKTEQLGPQNVLELKSADILPNPPLLPNQELTLTITIENTNQDPEKPINNIAVQLYDAPNFKNSLGEPCQSPRGSDIGTCHPELGKCSVSEPCSLMPGSEEQIVFRLLAPELDSQNKKRPTLSYRVLYTYNTTSSINFPVVSEEEIVRRQRAGEPIKLDQEFLRNSGPVYINAELQDPDFILGGHDAVLVFRIYDSGKGDLEENEIAPGNVEIEFPTELLNEGSASIVTHSFNCNGNVCTNQEAIGLYSGRSGPIYVQLKNVPNVELFTTRTIRAKVNYNYELRGTSEVEVKPYGT